MNRKQLILVLVALAVVGSAGLVLFRQHQESWNQAGARMGDKVLPNFRPNDIAAIHIRGTSDANIVHKNGLWRVAERNDYPANFGKISDLLIKLQNLKVVEAETVGPSQLARVNLDEPGQGTSSGTLVEFKDSHGKVIEALLLGKKHLHEQGDASHAVVAGEADGRYILLRKDPKNVFLISDGLAGVEPNAQAWENRDFFKAENVKSVSLAAPDPANSWKIFHDTESSPWVLADAKSGEVLDSKRALMITNALNSPRFADVAPASDLARTGLDKPMVLSIETFDHFAYTIKIGAKGPDDNYRVLVDVKAEIAGTGEATDRTAKLQAKLKQEQALTSWVYTVNSWVFDAVARDRAQILEGYKDEKAADAANNAASGAKQDKAAWTPRVIK
jgi:hypothetical protein